MLQTYHLFLFCVVPVSGFGFEKALRVANCLKDCSRFECRETCEQPTSTFDPYPQTNESAMVNITLHCKSVDVIMLSFNSGDYVIEQNTANGTWDTARVSNGNIAKFRDLDPGTSYRYRLHKLLETGFSQPEISDWFTTFEVDYVPQEVKNLSVSKILEDKKNPNQLQAEIVFEPAEDRSCKYNILSWYGEHRLINFEVNEAPIFSFNVPYLEYSQHITVSASASNKDNVSNETTLAFIVPSCLEFWHNLSICVPERVEGLRVEHTHRQGALYDVFVNWNAPEQEPDNYTIQLDLLNSKHSIYRLSVPGNSTQVSFLSLELTTQYAVSIIAESTSGTSLVTTVSKTVIHDRPGYVLFHGIMIGSSAFVTVVILFAVLFYRRYGRKNKHFTMDYAPFKSLNSKDSSLKMAKKPLSQTYAIERSNTPLMLDKFELLPDLLELKGILGNGAYGIVKLGVLKDDCGNAKSVAVKMLKGTI